MNNNIQVPIDNGLKKEIEVVAKIYDISVAEFMRRSALRELSRYWIKKEQLDNNIINKFINEIGEK